jgi:TonB family protein
MSELYFLDKLVIKSRTQIRLTGLVIALIIPSAGAMLGCANQATRPVQQAGWSDKVVSQVRRNIVFKADSFKGNNPTVIEVVLAPDGAILSRTLISSSGDPTWDSAALDALDRTNFFPKDNEGRIPQGLVKLSFNPN